MTMTVWVSEPGFSVASMRRVSRASERNLGQRFLFKTRRGKGERVGAHVDVLEGVVSVGVGQHGVAWPWCRY